MHKRPLFFYASTAILVILFVLSKYWAPALIESFYEKDAHGLLNALCQTTGSHSLDYYNGVAEEKIFGPVSITLATLVLTLLGLKLLPSLSFLKFTCLIFLFLVISRWEVFLFPVYGDQISGSFTEAIWLYRNNFDYAALLNQAVYGEGGPKAYVFSLYPGFLALLMKLFPQADLFLAINHITAFLMAAFIIAMFRHLLSHIVDERLAFLGSIFLLSLPLFQSMTEMINMEIPLLFFSIGAIYFLSEKKYMAASLWAIGACSIKLPGLIVGFTVFAASVLDYLLEKKGQRSFAHIGWGLACVIFIIINGYLRNTYVNTVPVRHNSFTLFVGVQNILWLTYIFKLYIASLAIFSIVAVKKTIAMKKSQRRESFLRNNFVTVTIFVCTTLWFILYANFSVMGPRYKLLLTPFLLYCIVYCLQCLIPFTRVLTGLFSIAVLTASFAAYGLFYRPVESTYYSYIHTERGLEYRNEMKLHQKLVDIVQGRYPEFTIGAPFITAHIFAYPELGYVDKPFDVIVYQMNVTYEGLRNYPGLANINIMKTMWIGFKDKAQRPFAFPIDPRDKVIDVVEVGDNSATLFMGGVAIERLALGISYKFNKIMQQRKK